MVKEQKKENIWNLPNLLTLSRVIIAFLTIYFVFADFHIVYVTVAFVIGMLTDALDGQVARRFNLKTEFGRKFDMVADRILMLGVAVAATAKFGAAGILTRSHLFQILIILSREILTCPIAFIAIIKRVGFPRVRFIGKVTTILQAITFPVILLSTVYKIFSFSLYFAVVTCIVGAVSAFCYINDIKNLMTEKRVR